MNKKFILLSEQFLVITGLEVFILNYLKGVVVPSFFLIWLLILTWEGNIEISLFMAFISGIVYDILSKGLFGITSIIFLIIVYINCLFRIQSSIGRVVGIFIFSIIYFLMELFRYNEGFLWNNPSLLKYSLLFAIYNSLIGFFIVAGMKRLRLKWKIQRGFFSI